MPSGPKKRKAAKKKQLKHSNNSNSSSTTHSHHGESDGGELTSPVAQDQHSHQLPFAKQDALEVKNYEDSNKSTTVQTTENIENSKKDITDRSSSSSNHGLDEESHVFEKKVVELVQPIESYPEEIAQEVEGSAMETNPFLDPVKPADSVLQEVNYDVKIENPNVVLEEMINELDKSSFVEKTIIVNESGSKENCSNSLVMIENGAAKLPSQEEIVPSESQDDVADYTHDGADRVNESETLQYSDKQPLIASAPQAVQTTSWKSCCGILELFSSSDRN